MQLLIIAALLGVAGEACGVALGDELGKLPDLTRGTRPPDPNQHSKQSDHRHGLAQAFYILEVGVGVSCCIGDYRVQE